MHFFSEKLTYKVVNSFFSQLKTSFASATAFYFCYAMQMYQIGDDFQYNFYTVKMKDCEQYLNVMTAYQLFCPLRATEKN